jgi:hypothetical protein
MLHKSKPFFFTRQFTLLHISASVVIVMLVLTCFLSLAGLRSFAAAAAAESASASASRPCKPEYCELQNQLFDWVELGGGYIHPSLELSSGDDPAWVVRGVFATSPIRRGEMIFSLPPNVLMCSTRHENEQCELIDMLTEEFRLGEDSRYWPYVSYLSDHEVQFPAVWNELELDLLSGMYPTDWGRHIEWYEKACGGRMDDDVRHRAMLLVVARANGFSGDTCLSPLYDSFNHGNYDVLNTQITLGDDDQLAMVATRDIPAGTQVYNNFGQVSVGRLFRDYGFISQSPYLWEFSGRGGNVYSFWEVAQADGSMSVEFSSDPSEADVDEIRSESSDPSNADVAFAMLSALKEHVGYLTQNEPPGFSAPPSEAIAPARLELAAEYRRLYLAAMQRALLRVEEFVNSHLLVKADL